VPFSHYPDIKASFEENHYPPNSASTLSYSRTILSDPRGWALDQAGVIVQWALVWTAVWGAGGDFIRAWVIGWKWALNGFFVSHF